jgi:hypothetical protein
MGSSSPPCLEPASTSIFDLHLCTCPPAASDPMGSSAGERSDANLRRGFPGSLGAVVEELLPGQVCGSTCRRRGLPWWEGLFGCAARRIDCSESGGPERSLRRWTRRRSLANRSGQVAVFGDRGWATCCWWVIRSRYVPCFYWFSCWLLDSDALDFTSNFWALCCWFLAVIVVFSLVGQTSNF